MRIIAAEATGAADYWYAKTSSPIKKLTDLTDKNTIAFSTRGSSTDSIVRAFIDEYKLKVKPMTTGNPSSTLTAVMTDQVDVGWASPPFGLKEIDEGKTRVVARATDSALVRGQTIRVVVANADALVKRKDVFDRFMKAYRETIAYMYSDNPQVMKDYAEFAGVSGGGGAARARRFLPARAGRAGRDPRHGFAPRRSGDAEVHPGAADQGAGGGAGADTEVSAARLDLILRSAAQPGVAKDGHSRCMRGQRPSRSRPSRRSSATRSHGEPRAPLTT